MVLIQSPYTFIGGLDREWLSDLQEFLHVGLPKLIFIGLISWGLILAVNFVTRRILQAAEDRAAWEREMRERRRWEERRDEDRYDPRYAPPPDDDRWPEPRR